jgi:predicted GH43/DUF377 family glycosyl hydrolase
MEVYPLSLVKAPERNEAFELVTIEPIIVDGPAEMLGNDLMSPYVWRNPEGGLSVLLRLVPNPWHAGDKTGRIWYGACTENGLKFQMDERPMISPGPGPLDIGGCEDPTVVPTGKDCVVYYTGLDDHGNGQMLFCEGPDVRHLTKRGVALASSKTERNTKEAAVERTSDGQWRLFYEYSRGRQSRVGLAHGPGPRGPWEEKEDPFHTRPECWDGWHLSTGPLLMTDPDAPVMFYNGANRDWEWAAGWIVFDRSCTSVVARSEKPLVPAPSHGNEGRNISFAASAIQTENDIWLYLSQNDRKLFRALIKRN